MNNLIDKAVLREATISRLERELEESKRNAENSEKTLERFQRKINRLRVALTREIDKVELFLLGKYCDCDQWLDNKI